MSAFQKFLSVCLILSLCSISYAGSLVGHWKLDETTGTVANDSAGANNGAVSGAIWTPGKIDGGLDFDGIDDKVIIPDSDILTPANTMTLSFWVYTSGGQDAGVYKWASCSTRSYVLDVLTSSNKARFLVYSSQDTADSIESLGTISLNVWHLITATFDSGIAKIYIDGVLDNTKTLSVSTIANDAQPLTFGGCWNRCGGTSWYARLDGMFDDVRLYDYALDANEVAALYGQAPQSGLVAHWKFDETSGNVAYDSAGTNNGTVSGALWTAGAIDGGLDFDGSGNYVLGTNSPFDFENTTFSVCAWFKTTDSDFSVIVSEGGYGNGGWVLGVNGYVYFIIKSSNSTDDACYIMTTGSYNDGQWHHVAATATTNTSNNAGNNVVFYIDGSPAAATESDTRSAYGYKSSITNWSIGARDGATRTFFDGSIDDVRIYNYGISGAEVAALYAQAPLPHVATTYHVATTGLDTNAGTSQAAAFATIQKGIDVAVDGDTVVVWPGTYDQQANFNGKAITVKSADAEPAVISNSLDYAFIFENAEEANSVLQNFIIANGCFAVYASGSSPMIKNLTIVDNYFGIDAYDDATPAVSNCIFLNNRFGDIEGADTQYSWPFDLTAVACWSFEETTGTKVYDGIGTSDGIITGATREPNGLLGRAMSFDGNGDYITVPSSASLDITGDITIAAWVKPTSFSSSIRYIAIKPYAYELGIRNANPTFRLSSGTKDRSHPIVEKTFTDLAFVPNQWNYIVVKREGASVKAWLNGKESAQPANVPPTAAIALSSYPFSIGTVVLSSPSPYYFVGQIDEVALFDRALSTKEIENYYKLLPVGYDYTDPMMVDPDAGDYHLLSEFGRYDLNSAQWILDDITSPCVDAGDPTDNPMGEPMPNGGRINVGAYGGIGHASKGGEWPLPFDFNTDGIVNMADFAKLAEHWLDKLPWVE